VPVLRVNFADPKRPQLRSEQLLLQHGPGLPIEIGLATPAHQSGPQPSVSQAAQALIDTGATHSCIAEPLAQKLNLPIIDQQQVSGVAGPQTHNVYLAQLSIPPPLAASYRGRLIGVQLGGFYQVIVGRDFLSRTLMICDGLNGTITISL
jgi:hypothetical protein